MTVKVIRAYYAFSKSVMSFLCSAFAQSRSRNRLSVDISFEIYSSSDTIVSLTSDTSSLLSALFNLILSYNFLVLM